MAEALRPAPDDESWLPPDVAGTVVTVGTFDGVHRGHHEVLARLAGRAREAGLSSLLVTFEPHPLEVVNPDVAPHLLTPGREKLAALAESGIDYVAVVPFTRTLAGYEAAQFVDLVLRDRLRMRELFVGHDHGFGRGRSGDAQTLRRMGAERGFRVEVIEPVSLSDGHAVSSTAIRRAVAGGDLDRAALGLGRPYGVTGPVVQGEARGRLLGYPTLNVALESPRKLLPPEGVYAVRVHTRGGDFGGMCNLGPRPTFGDAARSLEAHLFDAAGDWYDQTVGVDFVARLRDTQRFAGVEELTAQLGRDAQAARRALQRAR
ncbi:bifunctional riboflavin kinase/FAD synthetase [Roseisolibacter sp. H3M3-2]|uniref:bifunctional riboflavin kinase/FAD synthetase n=1 Tax=Roseisolibacter sp. H3M3-2 TaxID=3031323 RepID=UPI0023DAB16B|nr:bifunctional riboflavin kinase/FAD synthetase [Roseisolibacter sp. H3M3-2]MDF1504108.1 bifunctional riboflavin kinase/FAD synthetase [Roseisolibacter sp. H3M3-2]